MYSPSGCIGPSRQRAPLRCNENKKGVPPRVEYVLEAQALKEARDDPRWRRSSPEILLHDGAGSKRENCAGGAGDATRSWRCGSIFGSFAGRKCRWRWRRAASGRRFARWWSRKCERLVLVHPQRVKAIASAKLKNDRVDSATLAHLLRCDLLPESWKADRETQARRQQVRLRATLVRQRTRLKNQVHAVLHQQGLHSPVTDLFGKRGRLWLAGLKLPAAARESVNVCLRLLDGYSEEIQKQNLQISEKAKQDERVPWLMTIPGIGECSAMMLLAEIGDLGRFQEQRSVVQLRRAGAAGAGVGGQGGAGRDHAAGFAVAALDHGGSGAGGDALFAGGQALL